MQKCIRYFFVLLLCVHFSVHGLWSNTAQIKINYFQGIDNGHQIIIVSEEELVGNLGDEYGCSNASSAEVRVSELGELAFNTHSSTILTAIVSGMSIKFRYDETEPCIGGRLRVTGTRLIK